MKRRLALLLALSLTFAAFPVTGAAATEADQTVVEQTVEETAENNEVETEAAAENEEADTAKNGEEATEAASAVETAEENADEAEVAEPAQEAAEAASTEEEAAPVEEEAAAAATTGAEVAAVVEPEAVPATVDPKKVAEEQKLEKVADGWYSNNTATFIMPQKNVTVTPVFEEVNPPYINMPAYDEKIVSIPLGVTSFKVYDDGGKDGNNSSDAKGILILNAPEGYLFQISGTVDMADGAFLSFGEGDDAEDFELLQDVYSENTEIETITATKRSVGIYFNPNGDDAHSGLDLTITVFDPSAPHTVAINTADNGTVESDGSLVRAGETVTLTAAPNSNYILTGIEVRGVYDHQPVEVEGGFWYTGNSATFVMPQKDVEVTPVFGPASEAYINMPTTGTVMVDVPSGLTSFKVYDDGGIDENYSSEANGYLVLTAPAGYVFEISGTANTEEGYDYLNVYSGAIDNRVLLRTLSGSGASIGPVLSDVGSMVLNFYSDGSGEGQGFVLNVELVEATESHTITLNNITGGLVTSNTNSAQVGESVAIGVDLQNNYWLNKIKVVKDDGSSINVNYGTWYSMNSATFVMPYADVTVTPEYVTTPTAEGGLSVNIPTNYRSINVDIPRGVSSFKVHHDEIVGPGMGQIVLNAPEGTLIQVSGMDNSHQASLGIFEKDIYGDEWRIWGGEDGNTSPSLRSAGNKLRISLETGDPDMPLDLTVEIIDLSLAFNVNDADDIEHGSIDANTRSAAMGNVVTLTATPEEYHPWKRSKNVCKVRVAAQAASHPCKGTRYLYVPFECRWRQSRGTQAAIKP